MSHTELLKKIGLNEKEIRVYLALLKNGRITPTALSKITKINRATVYSIGKSLINKGIVAEDLAGKTLYLVALPPKNLNQMIEKPRRELKEKEDLVRKAIADLSLITADKKYPVPKIQFVEEDNLQDFLYENFNKWNTSLLHHDCTWWGFQDHGFVEHYEEWIFWTWNQKSYQDPRVKAKLLSNASPIEQKLGKRLNRTKRDIRFVEGMNFTSSMWIAGDYIVMIMTQQHPFYLFEIHDPMLAHNMRETFKKLWSATEPKHIPLA